MEWRKACAGHWHLVHFVVSVAILQCVLCDAVYNSSIEFWNATNKMQENGYVRVELSNNASILRCPEPAQVGDVVLEGSTASTSLDLHFSAGCFQQLAGSQLLVSNLALINALMYSAPNISDTSLEAFIPAANTTLTLQNSFISTVCSALAPFVDVSKQFPANITVLNETTVLLRTWFGSSVAFGNVQLYCSPAQYTYSVATGAALLELSSAAASQHLKVLINIVANITLDYANWPQNASVTFTSDLELRGLSNVTVVVDLQRRVNLYYFLNGSSVFLSYLTLVNLGWESLSYPLGFPCYAFDVSTAQGGKLLLVNSTLVVLEDELAYVTVWSTVYQANKYMALKGGPWMPMNITDLKISAAGDGQVTYQTLAAQGLLWYNVTITDVNPGPFPTMPVNITLLDQLSNVLTPLPTTLAVTTGAQFASALETVSQSNITRGFDVIIIQDNITLPVPQPVYELSRGLVIYGDCPPSDGWCILDLANLTNIVHLYWKTQVGLSQLRIMGLYWLPALASTGIFATRLESPLWFFMSYSDRVTPSADVSAIQLADVALALSNQELQLIALCAAGGGNLSGYSLPPDSGYVTPQQCTALPWTMNATATSAPGSQVDTTLVVDWMRGLGVTLHRCLLQSNASWFTPYQRLDLEWVLEYGTAPSVILSLSDASSDNWQTAVIVVAVVAGVLMVLAIGCAVVKMRRTELEEPYAKGLFYNTKILESTIVCDNSSDGKLKGELDRQHDSSLKALSTIKDELEVELSRPSTFTELNQLAKSLANEISDQQLIIHEVLGHGGYGTVYKGTWQNLPVAVKTIIFTDRKVKQRKNAMMEAAISKSICHPYIVCTYSYDLKVVKTESNTPGELAGIPIKDASTDYKLYIIQEFCDAGSMRAAIIHHWFYEEEYNCPHMEMILQLALEVAVGMAHLHSKNIVHGDLNPSNILLKNSTEALTGYICKIADFGLSVKMPQNQDHVSNLKQGTPFYVAPEVANLGNMTKAADVYSYGVMLWELYYGKPCWKAVKNRGYVAQPDFPRFPSSCPLQFAFLASACMSQDNGKRPTFNNVVKFLEMMRKELIKEMDKVKQRKRAQMQAAQEAAAQQQAHTAPAGEAQPLNSMRAAVAAGSGTGSGMGSMQHTQQTQCAPSRGADGASPRTGNSRSAMMMNARSSVPNNRTEPVGGAVVREHNSHGTVEAKLLDEDSPARPLLSGPDADPSSPRITLPGPPADIQMPQPQPGRGCEIELYDEDDDNNDDDDDELESEEEDG